MKRSFPYDTWAFMALANRRDSGHAVAMEIDLALESAGFTAVTTDYVIDETLTSIQSMVGAHASLAFLDELSERLVSSELTLVEIGGARRTDRHFGRAGGGILPLVERKGTKLIAREVAGI